jgi:mannosyltransferase OCH1-like enzyme
VDKIIHYCWLGGKELPEKMKYCIESWKRLCPDYEIKEWNESNYDIEKNDYIKCAYKDKKYAFVADYMRFDILYNYGGVYLDTDVELLRSLNSLINQNFMGMERAGELNPGLVMGCNAKSPIIKEIMDYYESLDVSNGIDYNISIVDITSAIFRTHGLKKLNEIQQVEDFILYPTEYFNPKGGNYGKEKITENTYSIHHYLATWKSPIDQKIMQYKVKYGNNKGRYLFAFRHPIWTLKKLFKEK